MSDDNKWSQPKHPPSPLFLGQKEKDLVKQVNDEIIERVVGQQVLYFPIDIEATNYHPIYGEAIEKTFLSPIRVYAVVEYTGVETTHMDGVALDKTTKITVKFHKRRLIEDQDLYVREGDFVRYGDIYYEIVKLSEAKLIFGQVEQPRFETIAECIRARDGLFNAR